MDNGQSGHGMTDNSRRALAWQAYRAGLITYTDLNVIRIWYAGKGG